MNSSMDVKIADRPIGSNHPPYIIAEMSGNHNGDIGRALAIIEAAAEAGADAVKLQTYTADTITIDADGPDFCIQGGLWDGYTLHKLYQEAHTPWAWHEALFEKGRGLGVTVFSAPFDATAVDFLANIGAPAFKIASFEAIDTPLIAKAASVGKPLIISTGMANLDEIGEAVETARNAGCDQLVLLHCVSGYPTPAEESNLATIADMARRFGVSVGLSDHSPGVEVAIAAVAVGAVVIEKHVTLRRADGGPDAAFSLEPEELRELVRGCRNAHLALGVPSYERTASELGNVQFRRSLYVVREIKAGEVFTEENVRSIRPGFGLKPKLLGSILGKTAKCDIARGSAMTQDLIA